MPDDLPEEKPEKLVHVRVPEPLPPSEREAYEGKIIDLETKNAELQRKLDEKEKPSSPPREKKKPGFLTRFSPLS